MVETNTAGLKKYLRENWGAPFVVCFMLLLLICAPLSVWDKYILVGNTWILLPYLAEGVAVLAYLMLVVGVILQLFSFFRHGEEKRRANELEKASSNDHSKVQV